MNQPAGRAVSLAILAVLTFLVAAVFVGILIGHHLIGQYR